MQWDTLGHPMAEPARGKELGIRYRAIELQGSVLDISNRQWRIPGAAEQLGPHR
jgi:hypothetical protein